jgi:hypothetical protein
MRRTVLAAVLVLVALPSMSATALAEGAGPSVTTVATGLDNPRGVTAGPDGTVYVAEAGTGADSSGAVTAITPNGQERVVAGLPSTLFLAEVVGPHDVTTYGLGRMQVTIGLGGTARTREDKGPQGALLGHVVRVNRFGQVVPQADLTAYETDSDVDGQGADSNPYGLLDAPSALRLAVDAGGNSLVQYGPRGAIRPLATFPSIPATDPASGATIQAQSVPTAVAKGPDGAFYVSELTGFPFPVDAARIWRVPLGGAPEVYAEGFTNVIDLTFDAAGNLYVLELNENGLLQAGGPGGTINGALIRVASDGTSEQLLDDELVAPGGLAFDADGALYVSTGSIFAGEGAVVRVDGL